MRRDRDDLQNNRILMTDPVVFVGTNSTLPKKEKLKLLRQRLRELEKQRHG